jgi:hypothetical protein
MADWLASLLVPALDLMASLIPSPTAQSPKPKAIDLTHLSDDDDDACTSKATTTSSSPTTTSSTPSHELATTTATATEEANDEVLATLAELLPDIPLEDLSKSLRYMSRSGLSLDQMIDRLLFSDPSNIVDCTTNATTTIDVEQFYSGASSGASGRARTADMDAATYASYLARAKAITSASMSTLLCTTYTMLSISI